MAQESYNYNKLFIASCIARATTAMAFSIRADYRTRRAGRTRRAAAEGSAG